jgi:multidrug efflux pump
MLARFFIDRPVLAWVISIVIILLGAIAVGFLPIAEYPDITPPTVRVTASYPGANAQVVSDTVAAPIEQQVVGVEGMLYMSSQSNNDGSYSLDVTFQLGTEVNMAQVLVQNRVAIAEPTLPDVVRAIGVTVKKQSPDILLAIGLYSESNPDTGFGRPGRPYYDQRHDPAQRRAGQGRGRRRRDHFRPTGLQHACVAGSGQPAVAELDGW